MTALLPAASNEQERQLDAAAAARFAALPAIHGDTGLISSLYNATGVTKEFLAVLGFMLSVDNWDSSWSDTAKRQTLQVSAELHRIKGTDKAVVDALAAIGVYAQIEHWYQADAATWPSELSKNGAPAPFTFRVDISNVAKDADTTQIKKIIDDNKRASAHYTVITAANDDATVYVTAAAVAESYQVVQQLMTIGGDATVYVYHAAESYQVVQQSMAIN